MRSVSGPLGPFQGVFWPAGQFLPVGWWAGPHKLHFYVFLQKPPVPDFSVNCFQKISPRPIQWCRICQWYIFFDLNFVLHHCVREYSESTQRTCLSAPTSLECAKCEFYPLKVPSGTKSIDKWSNHPTPPSRQCPLLGKFAPHAFPEFIISSFTRNHAKCYQNQTLV